MHKLALAAALLTTSTPLSALTSVQLANGMKVVVAQKITAPSAQLRLWVRAGSAHEQPTKTNVAHLIEHLMFGRFSAKEPAYFTQAKVSGEVNANTRHLATVYSIATSPEHLPFFLELEAKRLIAGPLVTQSDIAREVKVIKREHERNYSQLPYIMWRRFFQTAFVGHPFGWHTSGNPSHLDKIKPNDVKQFWARHYRPDRTCLVIVSPEAESSVVAATKKHFERWSQPKEPDAPEVSVPNNVGPFESFAASKGRAQAAVLGYRVPAALSLTGNDMDFLNHVLVRSKLSVLQQVVHYGRKLTMEFGDLNYDYDWFTLKSIIMSSSYQNEAFWRKMAEQISMALVNLSESSLQLYYREYVTELQERNLQSEKWANWLGRRCGKFGESVLELPSKATDFKAFRKKIKMLVKPRHRVLVVYGA